MTLDDELAARLQAIARERGVSFKEALNSTLRAGLSARRPARRYRVPTRRLELRPAIDLDKALQLAAQFEDDEIARKLELRK